jgi:hypothetical protein
MAVVVVEGIDALRLLFKTLFSFSDLLVLRKESIGWLKIFLFLVSNSPLFFVFFKVIFNGLNVRDLVVLNADEHVKHCIVQR